MKKEKKLMAVVGGIIKELEAPGRRWGREVKRGELNNH